MDNVHSSPPPHRQTDGQKTYYKLFGNVGLTKQPEGKFFKGLMWNFRQLKASQLLCDQKKQIDTANSAETLG